MLFAAGALVVLLANRDPGGSPDKERLTREEPAVAIGADDRRAVARALRQGVDEASSFSGEVEAAVMFEDWETPVVAGTKGHDSDRWMRMWSMSKVVVAVSLLRSKGWGEEPGEPLSAEVEEALRAALTRSENCPQRRLVLELQHSLGDSTEKAREEIARTVEEAGGRARPGAEVAPPDSSCLEFLESQTEIPDPLAPALLLGTSEWRVVDAVRFMRALGSGAYGKAVSRRILGLMREPKKRSREILLEEFSAPVDWGAGRALRGLDPAYKGGWGGTQQRAFMAGQMAVVELPSGGRAALAVMFHPAAQPGEDDPGLTPAPQALEAVMQPLARELRGAGQQPGLPR